MPRTGGSIGLMPIMFHPEPLNAKRALDELNPRMADRVDDVLDLLEHDHTQPRVRRHRLQKPALWMIVVRAPDGDGDDYAILWDLDEDTVVIRYIGPNIFH